MKSADERSALNGLIPNIEFHEPLGRGGMAVVWLASDHGFRPPRKVAVKFMDKELSSEPEFRARFEYEASIVANMDHENIVRVYASGEAASTKYMVMQYLSGGSLADRLRSGPIEATEAMAIAYALADALRYSHEQLIVHRDFKPGNVLFTATGKPVLTDFGVAKVVAAEQAGLTRHAAVIGAPSYMAPEQARADQNISYSADIYSFGVTLFEMLTGDLPPIALSSGDLGADGMKRYLPGQSPAVRELIRACLRLNPGSRPTAARCRDVLAQARRPAAPLLRANRAWRVAAYTAGGVATLALAAFVAYRATTAPKAPQATETRATSGTEPAATLRPAAPLSSTALPNTTNAVAVKRRPPAAKLYVDGVELQGAQPRLRAATHRAVAVAEGFYGEVLMIDARPQNATVEIDLSPTVLPSETELGWFNDYSEPGAISSAEVALVKERSLREALEIKLLQQQGDLPAVAAARERLSTLTAHGDDRAPVTELWNAAIARGGNLSESMITAPLVASSDGGDALASFFVALAHSSAGNVDGYCRRMRMAARSWQLAAAQLDGDSRCATNAAGSRP
jgi:hypothetical protein